MARLYKRGSAWYIDFQGAQGKRVRRSLGPITEAEAEAKAAALDRRSYALKPAAGPQFEDWALEYATWHSQEYPDSYFRVEGIIRVHLLPVLSGLALGMISPKIIETYKHSRLQKVAPATVSKEIRTLKAMLNLAVAWEIIPRNPIQYVKPPKNTRAQPPQWYTREDLKLIYAAGSHGHWWQLMANTGIRRSEALNLTRRNIGTDEMRIVSTPGARTKSGKWRVIPLSDGAREALEHFPSTGAVFPKVRDKTLTQAFRRDLVRSGLDGSLHCLRHTYCSHLVMAGVPLRTVQVLAGHASHSTTEAYAHLAPDHLQGAVVNL